MLQRTSITICAFITLLSCALSAGAQVTLPPGSNTPPTNFQTGGNLSEPISGPIRKGDLLRVIVPGADVLGGDFRVDVDGSIQIPRVGQLRLAGLMPTEAGNAVSGQIRRRKLLLSPTSVVYIIGRKAWEVLVNGAVTTQGRQTIKETTLLSEVLESSIPIGNADLSKIVITRFDNPDASGNKTTHDITVDYKQYRNGVSNDPKFNPPLEDGDRIYVKAAIPPEGTIRITGEVKDTQKVLQPIMQGATVGQVIQMAGGITEYADRDGVVLIRDGQRKPINYRDILKGVDGSDVKLQDRDEILIPKLERLPQFAVNGAVREAHSFPLNTPITLLEALGQAGGPVDGAQQNKVELRRKSSSGQIVTTIKNLKLDKDATTEIRDGDVVFVPFGKQRTKIDILSVAGLVSAVAVTLGQLKR